MRSRNRNGEGFDPRVWRYRHDETFPPVLGEMEVGFQERRILPMKFAGCTR